jgi:hypothetical protein
MTGMQAVAVVPCIQVGMGIFIPSGLSGEHLFVVIAGIQVIDGKEKVLLAPIESHHNKADSSCLLGVGDHEFIRHPSFVGYHHCRIHDVKTLEEFLSSRYYRAADTAVSTPVLERIKLGYEASSRIPRYIKNEWGSL